MEDRVIKRRYKNIDIKKIENKYNATYIGDFQLKNRQGEWIDIPSAVFYQENPPNGYSNYFGIFTESNMVELKTYIVNASSAFSEPISAVEAENGDILYSCHAHDYVKSSDNSATIDGGRSYTRYSGKLVKLIIDKDKLVVKNE